MGDDEVGPAVRFTVTEKATRPASDRPSDRRQCLYCQVGIGGYHKADCVLIKKKVKVRMIVEYEVEVPAHWDKGTIEFQRNEGSWCASNAIQELDKLFGEDAGPCMCPAAKFEYLGGDTAPYLGE